MLSRELQEHQDCVANCRASGRQSFLVQVSEGSAALLTLGSHDAILASGSRARTAGTCGVRAE